MSEDEAKELLKKELKYSDQDIKNLEFFRKSLLDYNSKYNLISRNTENSIWSRHILDSAQLIKYFDFSSKANLADLGSGAGFPGLILAVFNKNPEFHVKLYEKSPVKVQFLNKVISLASIKNVEIFEGDFKNHEIVSEYVVCRAFKKLDKIIEISREKASKSHKLIILKGKSAQEEVKTSLKKNEFRYKLIDSITDKKSKIIFVDEHI